MNEYILESLQNFRDIGGFTLDNKNKMKPYVVFRSEELSKISPEDKSKFKELGIKCIVDLRTPNERSFKPYNLGENIGTRIVYIPILSEDKDLNRWQFFLFLMRKGRKIDFAEYMRRFYYRLAFERNEEIKKIFTLLSDERNIPALVHCTGGKDRTGFIAALLQLVIGVPIEKVIESYLASNKLVTLNMRNIEKHIRWISLGQVSAERIRPMLEVRREYLEDTLDEILHRHKSIDEYLIIDCGVPKYCLENIRKLLTEPL